MSYLRASIIQNRIEKFGSSRFAAFLASLLRNTFAKWPHLHKQNLKKKIILEFRVANNSFSDFPITLYWVNTVTSGIKQQFLPQNTRTVSIHSSALRVFYDIDLVTTTWEFPHIICNYNVTHSFCYNTYSWKVKRRSLVWLKSFKN